MIKLGTINITKKTQLLMLQALKEGNIGQGKYVKEFEEKFAKFLGVKHAIATANGTLADTCALAAIKDGRNEVIVPALTFIAQINSLYYNHLTPRFVDVRNDYQIDIDKIEEKITKNTLAIMPAHLLGKASEMDKIMALAKRYNLYVIEDTCEALGTKYQGKYCGTIGDMGCFSFYPSHTLTTGEGGMIITNNDTLAEIIRSLINHGRKSDKIEDKFIFPRIGFNAKMNCMEAIIGLGIIDNLPELLKKRTENLNKLNELLGEPKEDYVPHCYPFMAKSKEERDQLLTILPQPILQLSIVSKV